MHIAIPIILALLLIQPHIGSGEQELELIACLDKVGLYHSGEHLNLTIFSYLGEAEAELDAIYVNLTSLYGDSPIPLACKPLEKGKYRAEYVLSENEQDRMFVITGIVGEIKKTIYVSLPFESPSALYISFPEKNSTSVVPGELLNISVECYKNSRLVEPETISLFVDYSGNSKNISLSRVSLGRYAGNFSVPALNKSSEFVFKAMAVINGKTETKSVALSYIPCHIWYNAQRITQQSASFDIGIADQNGKGLANAKVRLRYSTNYVGDWKEIEGKTNIDGIAHFYIAPDAVFTPNIYIKGSVENLATEFEFSIPLLSQNQPGHGFDVWIENSSYDNNKVKIVGRAYNNTKPIANSTLLYFLKNWGEIHGKVETDEIGYFTLEIEGLSQNYIHPYFGITIIFRMGNNSVEKIAWLNTFPDFWLDSSLNLEITNFSFGGFVSLSLSTKNTFVCNMLQPFAALYGDFQSWVPILAPIYFIPKNTTTMVCTFPLPAFSYSGQKNMSICAIYYESLTFIPHMAMKKIEFEGVELELSVLAVGEDYFVIGWKEYPEKDFLNYEILIAKEDGEFHTVANISEKGITTYRITSIGNEPIKAQTNYTVKLRVYFNSSGGVRFAEESLRLSTLPSIPGFTTLEVFAILMLAILLFIFRRL